MINFILWSLAIVFIMVVVLRSCAYSDSHPRWALRLQAYAPYFYFQQISCVGIPICFSIVALLFFQNVFISNITFIDVMPTFFMIFAFTVLCAMHIRDILRIPYRTYTELQTYIDPPKIILQNSITGV